MCGLSYWRGLLALLLSVALMVLVVRHFGSGGEVRSALRQIELADMLLPFALTLISVPLSALRWQAILVAMGARVPTRRVLFAVLASLPLAVLVPSRGGDLLRAGFIRRQVRLAEGLGSVVTEKLFDLQSLLLLALIGSLLSGLQRIAFLTGCGLAIFWAGLAMAPQVLGLLRGSGRAHRVLAALERAARPLLGLRQQPRHLALLVALSVIAWLLSIAIILLLLRATQADVEWPRVLSVWPAAVGASVLPITLSGVGARDGTFVYLLEMLVGEGLAASRVVAATLLYAVITNWCLALLGTPFALFAAYRNPELWQLAKAGLRSAGSQGPSS